MNTDKDKFLKRIFLYRAQYFVGFLMSVASWYGIFVFFAYLNAFHGVDKKYYVDFGCFGLIIIPIVYNTVTYFCSKYLADKYGIEMFADLDQNWLKEHQGFDSKAFGEIFSRLIQCRKIAGPYMLAVVIPCALIKVYFAMIVGIAYLIGYFIYRNTYLDTAIADKLPRAFGGGGVIISRILDKDEKNEK